MSIDSASAELRAFDAAARLGGMSAAARELGLTQPTVSAHITALEKRYGVELFYRRGRRVELTGFGLSLQELTRRIFSAEYEAKTLLQQAQHQYAGHLHVWAVGPYNITPLLKQYRHHWSGVQFTVSIADSRRIVQQILDYQGDLGMPVHYVDHERITCLPYRRQRLVLFAALSHPLAQKSQLTLKQLEGQEFVLREQGSTTRRVFEHALKQADVRIRVSLEMGSREAVREAVAQGLGLGIVADTAYVADPRLRAIALTGPELYTHAHIICLKERKNARLLAHFLSLADTMKDPG